MAHLNVAKSGGLCAPEGPVREAAARAGAFGGRSGRAFGSRSGAVTGQRGAPLEPLFVRLVCVLLRSLGRGALWAFGGVEAGEVNFPRAIPPPPPGGGTDTVRHQRLQPHGVASDGHRAARHGAHGFEGAEQGEHCVPHERQRVGGYWIEGSNVGSPFPRSAAGPCLGLASREALGMGVPQADSSSPLYPPPLPISVPDWGAVVGVPGLCWLRRDVPFVRVSGGPVVGALGVVPVVVRVA